MSKKRKRKQREYNQRQQAVRMQKIAREINSYKRIKRLIAKIIYGITAACIWGILFLAIKPTNFLDTMLLFLVMMVLFFLYLALFVLFEEDKQTNTQMNRRKKARDNFSGSSWGYMDSDNGCNSSSDSGCGSSGDGGGD
ncbi:hypothetical protein [Bacillus multifaciens]|uniref:hypothetical protein n=1 Tax=Bacillus multifaciens TaxID=3068506 RepID=UPI002740C550|nr:hypothetical protein [Bacillus sp. WLY-B-L8]MDP7979562.1 hypothetical protein [Bacillus sp. WLY-B-L8]